jgi:hypothetical protein
MASAYEPHPDREYAAIRNAAALFDVSPLHKYLIRGRDAARLLDLRSFERYWREQVHWMKRRPVDHERTITVEELLRHDPQMPRAVAEYQVRRALETRPDFGEMLNHEYAGVTSLDSLAALSVEDAAARWLRAQDHRWAARLSRRDAARRGCPMPPETDAPEPAPPHQVLGMVVRDSVAYILHVDPLVQMKSGDTDLHGPSPLVLHLRRRSGRWQILPRHDVLRTINSVVSYDCVPGRVLPRRPSD